MIWRRIDQPGHEAARLSRHGAGWRLEGTAVFAASEGPCRFDYSVDCDPDWRTRSARVSGWLGSEALEITVASEAGRWQLDGVECPDVTGCIDLDLNFSPSTNLLPIRRLCLAVGAEARVRAAWLRFPSFTLEPLEQLDRRTADTAYRYESGSGSFARDLRVNAAGFVLDYPGVWQIEGES